MESSECIVSEKGGAEAKHVLTKSQILHCVTWNLNSVQKQVNIWCVDEFFTLFGGQMGVKQMSELNSVTRQHAGCDAVGLQPD